MRMNNQTWSDRTRIKTKTRGNVNNHVNVKVGMVMLTVGLSV